MLINQKNIMEFRIGFVETEKIFLEFFFNAFLVLFDFGYPRVIMFFVRW